MISCKFSILCTDDGIKSEKLLLNIIFKPLVFDLPVTKTTLLVECIRHCFATHGLPFVIVTNHGPSFIRNKFKTLIQKNGIKHIFTAPYHPSLNSMDGTICSVQKCNKKD